MYAGRSRRLPTNRCRGGNSTHLLFAGRIRMSEDIFLFVCPIHGASDFWWLPDAQRVCQICFPRDSTPLGAAIPVNEDHLYQLKRGVA